MAKLTLRIFASIFLLLATSIYSSLWALEFKWGDFDISSTNFLTIGAGWRIEDRDDDLVYKLNIEGQQDLCAIDDCVSFTGDPEPNRRLVEAKGGYTAHLIDNGNLNYDKGDLYTALAKVTSDWSINYNDWFFKAGVFAYFDEANTDFLESHPNTLLQPARTKRPKAIEEKAGYQLQLRSWQIGTFFEVFDRDFTVTLGKQRLRWGESNLTFLNTLDHINPLDAAVARQPGFPIKDANVPVELLTVATSINENWEIEAFYQLKWRGLTIDPSGTLYSFNDPLGAYGTGNAILSLGQYPEDPDARYVSQGIIGLLSNSHRTLYFGDEFSRAPKDSGQFGFALNAYFDDFLDGTEVSFYYSRHHSRLPYFSMFAGQESCARNSTNLIEAADDCNGFNSGRHPETAERCDPRGCDMEAYLARELLPADTAKALLDYPEDLQLFGISFNTTAFGWSFAGEYAYRPDLPLQVLPSDVFFAGFQPSLPKFGFAVVDANILDLQAILGNLTNPAAIARFAVLFTDLIAEGHLGADVLNLAVPGSREIAPDFINQYRGIEVGPGDYIPGFERFDTHQFSLTAIKVFVENPVGSENVILALEVGATYIDDLPDTSSGLYLQGSPLFTHPSVGMDSTGTADGRPPKFTFNPTQQTDGFADDFSMGLRALVQLDYPNIYNSGINLKPTLAAFWDVHGIAPLPIQNFVEDNLFLVPGLFAEFGQHWSGSVIFQILHGDDNPLRDRDSVSVEMTYSF